MIRRKVGDPYPTLNKNISVFLMKPRLNVSSTIYFVLKDLLSTRHIKYEHVFVTFLLVRVEIRTSLFENFNFLYLR